MIIRTAWRVASILNDRWFVPGLILSVLLARVILAILTGPSLTYDPTAYHQYAIWIAEGKGYIDIASGNPTAYWPVGFPAFLGGVYYLFGNDPLSGELANCLLSALVLWLAFQITRQLFNSELAGRFLILLLALYPPQWQYSLILASEMLSLTLLLLILFLGLKQGLWRAMIVGGVAGSLVLIKAQTLVVAGIVWLFAVIRSEKRFPSVKAWLSLLMTYVVLTLIVAPWSWRNYQLFDQPVIVSTNGGINLFIGNNPQATGAYHEVPELKELLAIENEVVRDATAKERVISYLQQNPVAAIKRVPAKLLALYHSDYQVSFDGKVFGSVPWLTAVFKSLCNAYYYMLLLLALTGLFHLGRKQKLELLLNGQAIPLICALWFTTVYMIFFGTSRYHFLMMPLLSMYAAYLLALWFSPEKHCHGQDRV